MIWLSSARTYGSKRGKEDEKQATPPLLFKNGLSWPMLHHISGVWGSVRTLTAFLNMIKGVSNFSLPGSSPHLSNKAPVNHSLINISMHVSACQQHHTFQRQCPSLLLLTSTLYSILFLLGLISEPCTKSGNEKPSSFLGWAVGPSRGDVGREEGLNNVGINKYSEGDRCSVRASNGETRMREVFPINQPAQHY